MTFPPESVPQAYRRAAKRGLLPSSLSSREQRAAFSKELRARSVFSARTGNAIYLDGIRRAVEGELKGGAGNDRGSMRLMLKRLLERLEYTAEEGFKGDALKGVPSAIAGSLRDLSSDRRINLILDTQVGLMRGAGQRERGMGRMAAFPAWELVRVIPRKKERGGPDSGSLGWAERWTKAGGKPLTLEGRTVMMARKDDPVWAGLGDAGVFDDALDTDHPPFAFQSGMGWREVPLREWLAASGESGAMDEMDGDGRDGQESPESQGVRQEGEGKRETTPEAKPAADAASKAKPEGKAKAEAKPVPSPKLPVPVMSAKGMDADFKAELIRRLKGTPGKVTGADVGRMGNQVKRDLGLNSAGSREKGKGISTERARRGMMAVLNMMEVMHPV